MTMKLSISGILCFAVITFISKNEIRNRKLEDYDPELAKFLNEYTE